MKVQIIVSDVEQELFLDWKFSSDGKPRANSFGFPDDKTFESVLDVVVQAIGSHAKGLKNKARELFEQEGETET